MKNTGKEYISSHIFVLVTSYVISQHIGRHHTMGGTRTNASNEFAAWVPRVLTSGVAILVQEKKLLFKLTHGIFTIVVTRKI